MQPTQPTLNELYEARRNGRAIKKINILCQCLHAIRTHQVSTVSLHGIAQQHVTTGTDEFLIDFLAIFNHDSYPWHDGNYKKKNKIF
jgi:hypothetical protein